jgi:hypothetical protein
MRWVPRVIALLLLTGCGGVSDYSPDTGSRSSLLGNQGGAGVQAPLWSTDPQKTTITNQNPSP